MHDDVTRPNGSMVVVVTLKSKMATGSASSEGNGKSTESMIYLKALAANWVPCNIWRHVSITAI